jgi:hypothetical protein
MNLPELLRVIAGDLAEKAKDSATDVAYEAALDAFTASYRKFCISFARRYLDHDGTDHEILAAFREKFMSMMKLSTIALDEIDAYVRCVYVDKTGKVIELYLSASKVRREVRRGARGSKQ